MPDSAFQRGKVPMTKEEVRMVTIAKGRIGRSAIVYDIGSGTGSLTVEAAMLARQGVVYALEKHPPAVELTAANILRFGIDNVKLIQTEAPEGLQELPPANTILIGGSGGNLLPILSACTKKLLPGGRLVINAITLETLWTGLHFLEENPFSEVEAIALNVARLNQVGPSHMWEGLNPIYIVSASKAETKD